jgi:hypothetical protein
MQALLSNVVGSDYAHLFFVHHRLSNLLHSDKEQKRYKDARTARKVESNSATIVVSKVKVEGNVTLELAVVVCEGLLEKERFPNCAVEPFR